MPEEGKWYVVHTYSGYENKVASNLEKTVENHQLQDLIHEIRVPTEKVLEVGSNGKTKEDYVDRRQQSGKYVHFWGMFVSHGRKSSRSPEPLRRFSCLVR